MIQNLLCFCRRLRSRRLERKRERENLILVTNRVWSWRERERSSERASKRGVNPIYVPRNNSRLLFAGFSSNSEATTNREREENYLYRESRLYCFIWVESLTLRRQFSFVSDLILPTQSSLKYSGSLFLETKERPLDVDACAKREVGIRSQLHVVQALGDDNTVFEVICGLAFLSFQVERIHLELREGKERKRAVSKKSTIERTVGELSLPRQPNCQIKCCDPCESMLTVDCDWSLSRVCVWVSGTRGASLMRRRVVAVVRCVWVCVYFFLEIVVYLSNREIVGERIRTDASGSRSSNNGDLKLASMLI